MTRYQVIIPRTGVIINTVDKLERAKAEAEWLLRRLSHPKYPPEVVVQRVGPDGKRRKVWTANLQVTA